MSHTSPTAPRRLEQLRSDIDAHLGEYFAGVRAGLDIDMSPDGEMALEWLREFTVRPAKRLRGALAMVGYEMFGGRRRTAALDLAVAMELLQSYLLIVDDVMDRSAERRGGPTMHLQYHDWLRQRFGDQRQTHESNMMAVNVGLLAQHLAERLVDGVAEVPERVLHAGRVSQANLLATGLGQMDDLLNQAGRPTDMDAISRIYLLKSAHYTFINPLQSGAALAGASDEQLRPIKTFGLHAGMAFQLQDDILGMFGDAQQTGKSVLDDLREGKLTMLMQHALEHAGPQDLQLIRSALGNAQATVEQHAAICKLLERLGSRQYTRERAEQEVAAAMQVLHAQTAWGAEARAFLADLLAYMMDRKS